MQRSISNMVIDFIIVWELVDFLMRIFKHYGINMDLLTFFSKRSKCYLEQNYGAGGEVSCGKMSGIPKLYLLHVAFSRK